MSCGSTTFCRQDPCSAARQCFPLPRKRRGLAFTISSEPISFCGSTTLCKQDPWFAARRCFPLPRKRRGLAFTISSEPTLFCGSTTFDERYCFFFLPEALLGPPSFCRLYLPDLRFSTGRLCKLDRPDIFDFCLGRRLQFKTITIDRVEATGPRQELHRTRLHVLIAIYTYIYIYIYKRWISTQMQAYMYTITEGK